MQFRHVSVNRNFSETWSFGSFSSLKSIKQRTFIHCYRLNYVEMHQIQTEQTFVIGTDRLKYIPGTLMACFKSIETWSRNKFLIKNLTFSVERNIHKFVISNNLLLIENEKSLFSLFSNFKFTQKQIFTQIQINLFISNLGGRGKRGKQKLCELKILIFEIKFGKNFH